MCATLFEPRPLSWAGLLWIARLDAESRGEPIGIPCVVIARAAVGVHKAEAVADVAIRGTLPPPRSGTGCAVTVFHFAVTVLVYWYCAW